MNANLKCLLQKLKTLNFLTEEFSGSSPTSFQGLLSGISLVVKDNFCIKNRRTTCASRALRNYIPTYTATAVQRLIDAGAVVLGKSNMDEFGVGCSSNVSIFGAIRSPFNHLLSPGGSSGGSAVAVATKYAHAALGSDTGGSVRLPAAHCGIYGFKPTYGRISRHGLISFADSMDVAGFFARSSSLLMSMMSCCEGPDGFDSTVKPFSEDGHRLPAIIGLPEEYFSLDIDQRRRKELDAFITALKTYGIAFKCVSLKHTKYALSCYIVLASCELMSNVSRYNQFRFGNDGTNSREDCFYDIVKGRIALGNYFLLEENRMKYHEKALRVRRLIKNDFDEVFNDVDLLLTPSTLSDPPLVNSCNTLFKRSDVVFLTANLCGNPAVVVPLKQRSKLGIPHSAQLIAKFGADKFLLNFLSFLEAQGLVKCHSVDIMS